MRIGIVGLGTVGRAIARTYMEWADILVYDIDSTKSTDLLSTVVQCKIVFLCLPTPLGPDNTLSIKAIDDVLGECSRTSFNLVLKSTVPIGTTRCLRAKYELTNLIHSPEFLTARCAVADSMVPAQHIIGAVDCSCKYDLAVLLHRRFPGVPTLNCTSDESEAIKLMLNGFFATKVAYFNEMRMLADNTGLDWHTVLRGIMGDGRITHSHTQVPGPDGECGFSGSCLPKDLTQLARHLEDIHTYPPEVTVPKAVLMRNRVHRRR